MASLLEIAQALTCYEGLEGAEVKRVPTGLINETFIVRFGPLRYVLQRVNEIFEPAIHENIAAVTAHLAAHDIVTPELIPTREGKPCVVLEEIGTWRLMTHVDGVSYDTADPERAAAAGKLVGRVHSALDSLDHDFVGKRLAHDVAKHLAILAKAVKTHFEHPLRDQVAPLADKLLAAAEALPSIDDQPERICHGDLKISNVLFDPEGQALCLVDLDTLGPMILAHELGDAWRSWCNPMREDDLSVATFDMSIFAAAWRGYVQGIVEPLAAPTRKALLHGPEWITLELAARFAADALRESYFGWDQTRFSSAGDHNLVRARAQWALHRATVGTRSDRAKILGVAA